MDRMNGTPPRKVSFSPRFSLVDEEEEEGGYTKTGEDVRAGLVTQPYSHQGGTYRHSFNVDIEDNGDDVLLDWEQYSRTMPRWRLFGKEIGCLSPPDWWYHLTKGQRRLLVLFFIGATSFTLILLVMMALASLHFGGGPYVPHPDIACEWNEWRLPDWVKPTAYSLDFEVNMEEPWTVEASVYIDLDVLHSTRCVVLHAADMSVVEARLGGDDGLVAMNKTYDESLEQLTLRWDDAISVGEQRLYMTFTYPLREGMAGFYKSTYMDDGKEETLAATQFEANSARMAFPCFDEPHLKAPFTVEVVTSKDYTVLSNMPAKKVHHHDTQEEGLQAWHFETSPPMSTYLLAIIIGKLESVTREIEAPAEGVWLPQLEDQDGKVSEKKEKRVVQVWGIPSQIQHLEYAADAASQIVPVYENALKVAYALPKVDLVAIPDFAAGAMENWGLITYRQSALLVSPTSSLADTRYVTLVVAHELAHQWFGNLVTMSWWNELWLNEGFASYFEYLGSEAVHGNMSFLDGFYFENLPKALDYDGKNVSHALSMGNELVDSSGAIEGVFDAIEYQKGASVLRMLRAWMNKGSTRDDWESQPSEDDPFLMGINEYLRKHSFDNSTGVSLWESFDTSTELDLLPLMNEWTFRDGYPLVTVSLDGKGNIKAKQEKFSVSEEMSCDTENLWWIPISFVSSDSTTQIKWGELNACQSLRPLMTLPKNGWVKINAGQYGYYRVNYSPQLWSQLHDAVQQFDSNGYPLLGGVDVAGLVEDSFHVAGHGITMEVFLKFLQALHRRPVDEAGPWMSALPYIRRIDNLVSCQKDWSNFVSSSILEPFIENGTLSGNLGENLVDFFTFSGTTEIDGVSNPAELQMLRPAIIDIAGYFGTQSIVDEAKSLFKDVAKGKSPGLHPDLRSSLYNTIAKVNKKNDMSTMVSMLKAAENADESERIIRALGIFDHGHDSLKLSLDPAVKAQDIGILMDSISFHGGNKAAVRLIEWMQGNVGPLYEKLGQDTVAGRKLGQIIERAAAHIKDTETMSVLRAIQDESSDILEDVRYIDRAIESIRSNAKWVADHSDFVCDWISE